MKKIKATKAFFIKLGQGGSYAKEAIEEKNILKLGYNEITHNFCISGKWNKVRSEIRQEYKTIEGATTHHLNQINYFYTEGEDALWITFYNNKLWWCFSDKKVTLEKDNTKYRTVKGKWSCKNINNETLFLEDISGRLLRTQGFRGTICNVAEIDYLLDKINNSQPKDVEEVESSFNSLREGLAKIIQKLQPEEFELLIDLIFRGAGWQRLGVIGKTQKTIDLAIGHPITGERAVVQIKCQSGLSEYKRYQKEFSGMTEYDKFFYIAHTPEPSLKKYKNESTNINIYFSDKVAELAINAGLYDWILRIAG